MGTAGGRAAFNMEGQVSKLKGKHLLPLPPPLPLGSQTPQLPAILNNNALFEILLHIQKIIPPRAKRPYGIHFCTPKCWARTGTDRHLVPVGKRRVACTRIHSLGDGRLEVGEQKKGLGMFMRSNPPDPADGLEVKGDPWASGWPCWVGTDDIWGCGGRGRRPEEEQQGGEGRCELGFGQASWRSRLA